VRFVERAAVHSLARKAGVWTFRTEGGGAFTAPLLVNCAGAWGDRIAAMIGDVVPLTANGSMMMITARMPAFVTPVVGAAGRSLSLKQFENGTVLIGGGHRAPVDRRTNQTSIDIGGLARAASTALDLFPVLGTTQVVRFWSGIEGFTPDGLPVIGPSLNSEGAFHAFGFSAHGFQLGPIVGRIIAERAWQGRTDLPIAPFSAARFERQVAA
jgi:sarcosine oxidase subunit beta